MVEAVDVDGLQLVEQLRARGHAIELRERIGLISHNPLLYPDLSAEENLEFFASMYGVPGASARVRELLESVELDHRRLDLVRNFSRGMLQRLDAITFAAPVFFHSVRWYFAQA